MRFLPVLASLLLVGSFSIVSAQQGQGSKESQHKMMSVEDRVNQLKITLDLSADQVTKITAIMQSQRDTMKTLHEKYGKDHEAMRQAMSTLRPTFEKQISAVLTEAQQKKYDAIIAQHEKSASFTR